VDDLDYVISEDRLPKVSFARWTLLAGIFVYLFLLCNVYIYFISPSFYYLGFIYQPQSKLSVLLAVFIAFIPSLWTPVKIERPSQLIYFFLYLMVVIPSLTVGSLTGTFGVWKIVYFGIIFTAIFGALRIVHKIPLLKVPRFVETEREFWVVFLLVAGLLYGVVLGKYGFPTQLPSLGEVYAQRSEFRREIAGIGAYAFFWTAKAVNPLLVAKGFLDRNPILILAGVVGQFALFAMSGMKAILFSPLLFAAILLALWPKGKYFGNWVVWGLLSLIAGAVILDSYVQFSLVLDLFVRRLVVVPGLNTSYYLDFFSTNPKVFLGHSIFSGIVNYPYEELPAMVVGDAYFGHVGSEVDVRSNANIWADAYASFGLGGILLFSSILGGLFWVIDSMSQNCSFRLAVLMMGFPAYNLVDTKLQTSLLTHGIGLVLLLLYILPPEKASGDES